MAVPERRLVDIGLAAVALAYGLGAMVGLPLFEDGGWYFFKIVTDAEPVVPNLRFGAVIPQLPGLLAARLGADATDVRHAFSLGYAALPVLSLLTCWLLVRRTLPALMLLPLLHFLLNLINFSGVSELLTSLYLTWPLVIAMALYPGRPGVRAGAAVAGPLLVLLHPMAFLPALGLAALALILARVRSELGRVWLGLGGWLAVSGLLRLGWTLVHTNAYERSNLSGEGFAHYVLTETAGQHLLLAAVMLLAAAVAGYLLRSERVTPGQGSVSDGTRARLRPPAEPVPGPGTAARGLPSWLAWGFALLPLVAVTVSLEITAGEGIKLKSAATFATGLLLMALAALAGLRAGASSTGSDPPRGYGLPAALVLVAMLLILLTKSAAWWTATLGLRNLVAEAEVDCIPFAWHRPFGLQWPWMGLIDDWATPMNALAFRPELPLPHGAGMTPVPLLLPDDGCQVLKETGLVRPTPWIERPFEVLEERFGPLRDPRAGRDEIPP
jgi:hypothetical protein